MQGFPVLSYKRAVAISAQCPIWVVGLYSHAVTLSDSVQAHVPVLPVAEQGLSEGLDYTQKHCEHEKSDGSPCLEVPRACGSQDTAHQPPCLPFRRLGCIPTFLGNPVYFYL